MKPKKPYPTFPLTPHVRGGWSKRYKGKQLYLPDADPKMALADFHARAAAMDRGAKPVRAERITEATVGYICTRYAKDRRLDAEAGRLSYGALQDYRDAAVEMSGFFGRDTLVADLAPDDFSRFYRYLEGTPDKDERRRSRPLGTHAVARMVRNCRTIWKHAAANDWIGRLPRYGSQFKIPVSGKKAGVRTTIEDVRAVLSVSAAGQLRAMILLALNGGYVARDCAALPRSLVDLARGVIVFPRPKMRRRKHVDRACTLWPVTLEALAEAMAGRPGDDLAFRTIHGNPWVATGLSAKGKGSGHDSVGLMYRTLCKWAGVAADGFADLRHLHRTLADELEKPHAAARVMGHLLPGMAEVYVDRIEHDRLKEITDHIFRRIFVGWSMPCPWSSPWPRTSPAHPGPAAIPPASVASTSSRRSRGATPRSGGSGARRTPASP